MSGEDQLNEHPSFTLAKSLPERWREHFPTSAEEAREWKPYIRYNNLASRVLVVAKTRVEVAWCAYCDSVPGWKHDEEYQAVLDHGDKLSERIARQLFPEFEGVPYAH